MATNFATVQVLFRKNHFVATDPTLNWAEINCSRISAFTPRQAWLIREKATDGQILYTLTFAENTATNTLKGFWIEQDGEGMLIDVKAVNGVPQTLLDFCGSCCDASPIPTIETEYDWEDLDTLNMSSVTRSSYCIFRPNADGGLKSLQGVIMDYVGMADDIAVKTVSTSPLGVYYTCQSYQTVKPVGSDTVTSGACS